VWSRGQPHLGGCHLAAALSTACQVGEEPLTLSVAPRAWPDRVDPTRLEAPRTASPTPSSKGAACSIQSAFHRQVAPKESRFRTTVFGGNPPPVSRLCRRGPGFRRAFAAPMLSPGVARPDVGSRGSSPRVATGQTPPVDFCNLLATREHIRRIVRTPRTTLVVAHLRSSLFEPPSFDSGTDCGWPCVLRHSQSRGHGPGACSRAIRPLRDMAPPAAIARGGSFTPTRSARTPPVASSWRRRLE
jgi:hypothetical protein